MISEDARLTSKIEEIKMELVEGSELHTEMSAIFEGAWTDLKELTDRWVQEDKEIWQHRSVEIYVWYRERIDHWITYIQQNYEHYKVIYSNEPPEQSDGYYYQTDGY